MGFDVSDLFEPLLYIVLLILGFVAIYVYGVIPEKNKQEIREMIIKDSSEYIIYNECIKIDNLYYCK